MRRAVRTITPFAKNIGRKIAAYLLPSRRKAWSIDDRRFYMDAINAFLRFEHTAPNVEHTRPDELATHIHRCIKRRTGSEVLDADLWAMVIAAQRGAADRAHVETKIHDLLRAMEHPQMSTMKALLHTYHLLMGGGMFACALHVRRRIKQARSTNTGKTQDPETTGWVGVVPQTVRDGTTHPDVRAVVEGQRVVVVGPIQPRGDLASYIDSFDVVVRINVHNTHVLPKEKGTKTTISYLSGAHEKGIEARKETKDGAILFYMIKKRPTNTNTEHKVKEYPVIDRLLFTGTANGIPNIVADLLRYQPQSLHVVCADMMLTEQRDPAYHDVIQKKIVNQKTAFRLASFLSHDPASQFNFMRAMHARGLVQVDTKLAGILAMDEATYYQHLDSIYRV